MTIDCDAWRAGYDDQTPEDARAFHSAVYAEFPNQSHFSSKPLSDAVHQVRPKTVVEVGGWDGEAAGECLASADFIESWINVEVCPEAAAAPATKDRRYIPLCPDGWWFWSRTWSADLFVAVHVIEHLKARHLEAAVEAVNAPFVYFEAPLMDGPTEWAGSSALHILEVGWHGVTEIMARQGYEPRGHRNLVTPPSSGGFSRAVLYGRAGA